MKTRTWILIFAVIFVICLGAGLYFLMPGDASTSAEITRQGQVIKTVEVVREIPVYHAVPVEDTLLSHITEEQLRELLPVGEELLAKLG